MGIRVVVNGATLKCTEGTKDSNLVATHEPFVALNGETVASVLDHEPGTNIQPFGNCKTKEKKAGKPCKCKPDTPSPWQPGARAVLLPTLADAVVEVSLLECTEGSVIRITNPGQTVMEIEGAAEAELYNDLLDILEGLPIKLLLEQFREIIDSLNEENLIEAASRLRLPVGGLFWSYYESRKSTDRDCQHEPSQHPAKCLPGDPPQPPEPPTGGPHALPSKDILDRIGDAAESVGESDAAPVLGVLAVGAVGVAAAGSAILTPITG